MRQTYLFYDIETTGLSKCFDQVLQFAAIRTDLWLNEIERYNFFVKLNLDVVPAPEALITHHISFEKINNGLCEYEAAKKIHDLLNKPGTISLGYNTLGFDDEFLRFTFYRNLLTPYTHQYADNCRRMDLYPMAVAYFLYKPKVLNWPTINGKSSLKLESLSELNKLATGDAHDALVDVEATVALARKFKADQKMWDYLSGYFDKSAERLRNKDLLEALMLDGSFGVDNSYQSYVLFLGRHNFYKNQTVWLRLDWDLQEPFVINKKDAEAKFLLPPHERFTKYINQDRWNLINSNKQYLSNNPEFLNKLKKHHLNYQYPYIPNLDLDGALYQNGFMSERDKLICGEFHASDIDGKIQILDRASGYLQQQMLRLLARNYPEKVPSQYLDFYREYLSDIEAGNKIIDYRGNLHLTRSNALNRIQELTVRDGDRSPLTSEQIRLLAELQKYLNYNHSGL